MRIDRPHSEILFCQTRGRCEMQNAPPQRHTTTINSIKNTGHESNCEPSMKNAQHNTHTHTHEPEKLRLSRKPVNLNLGRKNYFFSTCRPRSRQAVW